MRAVVQRVSSASIEVDKKLIASIGAGILTLVAFRTDDRRSDLEYISNKIMQLRIFNDDSHTMNRSLTDISGELLIVSQFTLYGDVRKGRRPSYSNALNPKDAVHIYNEFVTLCKETGNRVYSGEFGADMQVNLVNSGPVTILLDSRKEF